MGLCTTFIEPLNLECIFVNNFAGSFPIFTALSFLVISFFAAKFRMPNEIALIMFVIFAAFMAKDIGSVMSGIYVLGVLLSGILIFYSISKIVKN